MSDSGPNKESEEELERFFLSRNSSGLSWCGVLGYTLASLPGCWQMAVLARRGTFLAQVRRSKAGRVAGGAPRRGPAKQQRQESQEEAQEGEGVEENAEVQEGEKLALDPQSVDMRNPLTPAEEEVKASVSFVNRKKKGGHGDCFGFKYKLPWGPQTKPNYSKWYASQEAASRAIFQWRVEVISLDKPSSNGATASKHQHEQATQVS